MLTAAILNKIPLLICAEEEMATTLKRMIIITPRRQVFQGFKRNEDRLATDFPLYRA
jgi:hypothetical protein